MVVVGFDSIGTISERDDDESDDEDESDEDDDPSLALISQALLLAKNRGLLKEEVKQAGRAQDEHYRCGEYSHRRVVVYVVSVIKTSGSMRSTHAEPLRA